MKKDKFKKFTLLLILLISFSCENSENSQNEKLSFESIEKEFDFNKPLSTNSRQKILENYGTIENYREFLKHQVDKISSKTEEEKQQIINKRRMFDKDQKLEKSDVQNK